MTFIISSLVAYIFIGILLVIHHAEVVKETIEDNLVNLKEEIEELKISSNVAYFLCYAIFIFTWPKAFLKDGIGLKGGEDDEGSEEKQHGHFNRGHRENSRAG